MITIAQKNGCEYAEAFCIMKYATKDRSESELIWNSRDGVIPYCIFLKSGKEANHIDWSGDMYLPIHVPAIGSRMFVNLSLLQAMELRRESVNKCWAEMQQTHLWSSPADAITDLATRDVCEFGEGTTPYLVTVDVWWHNEIKSRRPRGSFRSKEFA